METNYFQELKKYFEKFPGIGPRQASRFIWALLDFSDDEREKFSSLITSLDRHLNRCESCFRIFPIHDDKVSSSCSFCVKNSHRDHSKIMVVERDSDLLNIEKSGAYKGLYSVLGGLIDPLEKNELPRERIKILYGRVSTLLSSTPSVESPKTPGVFPCKAEVILALSPTKLGEFTSNYVHKVLEPLQVKITRLARGLSTGVELEYADEYTLRHALDNRK